MRARILSSSPRRLLCQLTLMALMALTIVAFAAIDNAALPEVPLPASIII